MFCHRKKKICFSSFASRPIKNTGCIPIVFFLLCFIFNLFFSRFIFLIFNYVYMWVSVYRNTHMSTDVCGDQKSTITLRLDFQVVVSLLIWGLEVELRYSGRLIVALSCLGEIFLFLFAFFTFLRLTNILMLCCRTSSF